MKKILVNGYFGVNFGDDLFFKILFERYKNTQFEFFNNSYMTFLYDKYVDIYKEIPNVNIKKYNKIRKICEKINFVSPMNTFEFSSYDGTVFIGGSIFMENENWKKTYYEKNNIISYFNKNRKKVFVLGSNFGPYSSEEFKNTYKKVFEKCDDICFRDKNSYELFKDLQNVRVATDVVFSLKKNEVKKIRNSIGISIIDLTHRNDLKKYEMKYISKMVEIIENLIQLDKKITLFSFCEKEGDMKAIEKIMNLLKEENKKKVNIENYTGNINDFLIKLESQENIIGCRFHSIILSQVFGQTVYPLIYSNKTYNMLSDLNMVDYLTRIENIDNLEVKKILEAFKGNKLINKEVFKIAEKQFKHLDEYLN